MPGPDTWRGIDFQAAYAVDLAINVLTGDLGALLEIETGPDIVDYDAREADGNLILIGQAKTRGEPYTWPPGELSEIIRRLGDVPNSKVARLEFVTDGFLSPDSARRFRPAIERAAAGGAGEDDWGYLAEYELGPANIDVLRRVRIVSDYDHAGAILAISVGRVRALRDLIAPIGNDEAELLVGRLLRRITETGTARTGPRTLSRDDIGELLGVPPSAVDAAAPWSDELANRLREQIAASPLSPAIVELEAEGVSLMPQVVAPIGGGAPGSAERLPVTDLLDRDSAIIGPTGAGKSYSMELIQRRAAEESLIPVLLRPTTYQSGRLAAVVRQQLVRDLGLQLGPGAGPTVLARPDTVLILDGAGELPARDMVASLARDLTELRRELNAPTVIVSGRSLAAVRPYGLATYRLQLLDRASRRGIATVAVGNERDAARICAQLERDLGGTIDLPLLFTMALHQVVAERPAGTVGAVFRGFLQGIRSQAEVSVEWGDATPCLEMACWEMVRDDRFSMARWDWLMALERSIESLQVRGLIAPQAAVEFVEGFLGAGILLLSDDGGSLSLLHDSFRDWLASEGAIRGLLTLPEPLTPQWKEVAGYLAESGEVSEATLLRFCDDLVVAASAAAREVRAGGTDLAGLATRALSRLVALHLGPGAREGIEGSRIIVAEEKDRIEALLVPVGASDDEAARAATLGADLPIGSGPLSCALAMLFAHVRHLLRDRADIPTRPPEGAVALAEAVRARFVAQRDVLISMTEAILPGLRETVLLHAGWTGLIGHVGEVQQTPLGPAHPFVYSHRTNVIEISTGPAAASDLYSARSTAEDWLRGTPRATALRALRSALSDMLPGFGG